MSIFIYVERRIWGKCRVLTLDTNMLNIFTVPTWLSPPQSFLPGLPHWSYNWLYTRDSPHSERGRKHESCWYCITAFWSDTKKRSNKVGAAWKWVRDEVLTMCNPRLSILKRNSGALKSASSVYLLDNPLNSSKNFNRMNFMWIVDTCN